MPDTAPDTEPGRAPGAASAPDFRRLPDPIPLEAMVTGQDVRDAPDPDAGRDPNHEWMLRYG